MAIRFFISAILLGGLLTSVEAADKLEKRKSPKGAKAYIISPKDGRTVKKKFTVRFGLKGMGVAMQVYRCEHRTASSQNIA